MLPMIGLKTLSAIGAPRHFPPTLTFVRLWLVVGFSWQFYHYWKFRIVFPPLKSVHHLFHEGTASGSSGKNWLTRIGGANNCLRVTVTDSEVWIRTFFPFNLLARSIDLEHRIPRESILAVERLSSVRRQRIVLLDFQLPDGGQRRLKLRLKNPQAFLAALRTLPPPLRA